MISDCTQTTVLPHSWGTMVDAPSLELDVLRAALTQEDDLDRRLRGHQKADPTRPYGRHVLLQGKSLEVMLATWTRGIRCAPHDHGGSEGLVRVLQGRARHRIYSVKAGRLRVVHEETAGPGDLLTCGDDLVHCMGDDGADLPLVTLHMYTGPVAYMVVYDEANDRTLKVDGSCGAWTPTAGAPEILMTRQGMVPSHEML